VWFLGEVGGWGEWGGERLGRVAWLGEGVDRVVADAGAGLVITVVELW